MLYSSICTYKMLLNFHINKDLQLVAEIIQYEFNCNLQEIYSAAEFQHDLEKVLKIDQNY